MDSNGNWQGGTYHTHTLKLVNLSFHCSLKYRILCCLIIRYELRTHCNWYHVHSLTFNCSFVVHSSHIQSCASCVLLVTVFVPCAVGRFCYYGPNGTDQADNVESFSEYNKTLTLQCEEGEPGVFTWTPDETTPNEVYYQVNQSLETAYIIVLCSRNSFIIVLTTLMLLKVPKITLYQGYI